MDTLALATDTLELAHLLGETKDLSEDDCNRIDRGRAFVLGLLSAVRYLNDGTVEGLDDNYFQPLRNTSRTLRQLSRAGTYASFRKYLEKLAKELQNFKRDGRATTADSRRRLQEFFAAVGQALVTDEINRDDDEEFNFPPEHEVALTA